MKTRIQKRFLLIPVLYIAIIISLMVLQFSTAVPFHEKWNNLELSGIKNKHRLDNLKDIKELNIILNGITISFNRTTKVQIHTIDGQIHNVGIIGYELTDTGILCFFDKGLNLQIQSMPGEIKIEPFIDIDTRNIKQIVLTYNLNNSFTMEFSESGEAAVLNNGSQNFLLSSNIGASIKTDTIHFYPDQDSFPPLSLAEGGTIAKFYYQTIQDDLADFINEAELTVLLNNYINSSWSGWDIDRYRHNSWQFTGRSPQLTENLINAYLAESVTRGVYGRVYGRIRSSLDAKAIPLTYQSSVFLGDIINQGDTISEELSTLQSVTGNQLDSGDFSILEHTESTRVLASFSDIRKRIRNSVQANGVEGFSPLMLKNLLVFYINDYSDSLSSSEENYLINLLEQIILPGLVKNDHGIFLGSNDHIDTELSLETGLLLAQLTGTPEYSDLAAIGRELVSSVLSTADDWGFFHGQLDTEGNAISENDYIAPEEIYALLPQVEFYPRFIDTGSIISQNSWIFSAANKIDFQKTTTNTRLDVHFPEGFTHHLIVNNLNDLKSVSFYGINWTNDVRFQYYNRGYYYSRNNNRIFMKVKHYKSTETIIFFN